MAKYLQLHIPKPCHENWTNMDTREQGRFCHSCSETVIDFTAMTDAQVLSFFKKNNGQTCGRFLIDQLDNPILIPSKKISWIRYLFTVIFPAFMLTLKTQAQKNRSPVTTMVSWGDPVVSKRMSETRRYNDGSKQVLRSGRITQNQTTAIPAKREFTGQVVDSAGVAIPFASVIVKGGGGVQADANGEFSILLPNNEETITFSSEDYFGYTKAIPANMKYLKVSLKRDPNPAPKLIVVSAGFVTKRIVRERQQQAEKLMIVYPNPARSGSRIQIKYNTPQSSDFIARLFDSNGCLYQTTNLVFANASEASLILAGVIPGVYILRVTDEKGNESTARVVVE